MEVLQLVYEAFLNSPIFFIVPALLFAFVVWSPWSPPRFYVHHDGEAVENLLNGRAPESAAPELP